jgi:hypothetical protein
MKREVAVRMFSTEFIDMFHQLKSNSKTIYYLAPTGVPVNRVFAVGVLLEKHETSTESNFWKIKIADPTGTFYGYISRYQTESFEKIHDISELSIVAVTGKIKVLETENGKFTTLRPENITTVDETIRDLWVCETAKRTLERIAIMKEKTSKLSKMALEVYKPDLGKYINSVKESLRAIHDLSESKEEDNEEDIDELLEEIYDFTADEWDMEQIM